ncbi:schlafen family member 13-like [Sardina pilchardus]|uniref:schlafen family member 13-like n=1 Tax=Sardina pilchardus TaxID=27697 RepID=UPI002E13504E
MFIGINDGSQKVIGCGSGLDAEGLLGAVIELCNRSEAIHTPGCSKKNASWSPECKLIQVIAQESSEADGYVVVIKIPAFCCAVFEQDPNSWHIEKSTVCRLGATVWMEKIQPSDPDDLCERFQNVLSLQDAPPQCKPVYSIDKLTRLQEKLFPVPENNIEVVPDAFKNNPLTDAILTANSAEGPGICICSKSWAVDIDLSKNDAVFFCEALIISTGSYPTLWCVVDTARPDLWEYATNTAFHLKQKLVNLGGYTGKLCVIPQLVERQNMTVMDHHLQYPNSYRLDQEKDVTALLRSLVIVLMSFTSPLSDEIGCEFLNLLTEEQFRILQTYDGIKNLFVHGVPGSGKTLIAMALIRRIKNSSNCEDKHILYLCENVGLREFMRKQNLCQCETRVKFLAECTDFSAVKHIIVDEAQNFRVEKGESNWYEKALKLRGADGMFWIFLDYHQKCHDFPDGLPPISTQSKVVLLKVVRNSAKVLNVIQFQMQKATEGPQSEVTQHLAAMNTQMELSHSFQGSCINREAAPGKEMDCVLQILEHLFSQGHTARDIAVLFSTQEQLTAEEFKLKATYPILFSSVEEDNPGNMVLDTIRRFTGLERNIVILVNPSVHPFLKRVEPNFLISAYSRARVRLYVVKPR